MRDRRNMWDVTPSPPHRIVSYAVSHAGLRRCRYCGARDDRDPAHAAGCPALPRPSQEALLAMALACERGWREKAAR